MNNYFFSNFSLWWVGKTVVVPCTFWDPDWVTPPPPRDNIPPEVCKYCLDSGACIHHVCPQPGQVQGTHQYTTHSSSQIPEANTMFYHIETSLETYFFLPLLAYCCFFPFYFCIALSSWQMVFVCKCKCTHGGVCGIGCCRWSGERCGMPAVMCQHTSYIPVSSSVNSSKVHWIA